MNYIGREPAPSGVVLVGDSNPVGMIGYFHAPPTGWLVANGQTLLKASYPDLWAYAQGFLTANQTTFPGLYRDVDAANFALPNLSGLFVRSAGTWDANHVAGALGSRQDDTNLAHTHTASDGGGFQTTTGGPSYGSSVAGSSSAATTSSNGGTEAKPINVSLVPCVKALLAVLMPTGTFPAGRLVQSRSHVRTDFQSQAGTTPFDDTIPQITEGAEFFSIATFAPMFIGSRVRLRASIHTTSAAQNGNIAGMYRAGTPDALAAWILSPAADIELGAINFEHEFISASLAPFTYSLRIGSSSGAAIRINGRTTRSLGGAIQSFFKIDEYSP